MVLAVLPRLMRDGARRVRGLRPRTVVIVVAVNVFILTLLMTQWERSGEPTDASLYKQAVRRHLGREAVRAHARQEEKVATTHHHHHHDLKVTAGKLWRGPTAGVLRNSTQFAWKRGRNYHMWSYEDPESDRIEDQLEYELQNETDGKRRLKKIMAWTGIEGFMKPGRQSFIEQGCKVNMCTLTARTGEFESADAVFFRHSIPPMKTQRKGQVWVVYALESPYHMFSTESVRSLDTRGVNYWFATYRHDADIATPYERFRLFDEHVTALPQGKDLSQGKDKMVAWFVSNCNSRNGREKYARELAKYIEVDIYGGCGSLSCPRFEQDTCFAMLRKRYRFYLSFENSNCRDYITEKLFWNALNNGVVPVVMGAHPDDYRRQAPHHSYIHVEDFASPRHLAAYLTKLSADADAYNAYFAWRGTGDFINTKFYCRLCAMLHAPDPKRAPAERFGGDVGRWYSGEGVCITGRWDKGEQKWRKE